MKGKTGQCTIENLLSPAVWEGNFTKVLSGWRRMQLTVAPLTKLILSESATTGLDVSHLSLSLSLSLSPS